MKHKKKSEYVEMVKKMREKRGDPMTRKEEFALIKKQKNSQEIRGVSVFNPNY